MYNWCALCLTCSCASHASCLTCSCNSRVSCFTYFYASYAPCLTCSRTSGVPRAICALAPHVPSSLCALMHHVPRCSRYTHASLVSCPTCFWGSDAVYPSCSRVSHTPLTSRVFFQYTLMYLMFGSSRVSHLSCFGISFLFILNYD